MDPKVGFRGLVTATGELMADRGALRIADNVTLRKEGALMPRPVYTSTALARAYAAAFPFKGALMYVTSANAVYSAAIFGQYDIVGWGSSMPAVRADIQSGKEARGNFYFASIVGVLKLISPGTGRFGMSGARPGEAHIYVNGLTAGTLLTQNTQVAYRFVVVKTDLNGLVLRSRPTGAQAISLTTAGTYGVQIVFQPPSLDPNTTASLKVEVYRTRVFPTSVQIDDDMQLVATIDAPTSGTVLFVDNLPDANRGMTLYTSPSRGGAEAANDNPPGCACIERFRGSLFFGNIVGPHRVTFSYNYEGVRTGQATLIGERTFTANTTNGGTTLTNVSNTTGLQVGMFIFNGTGGGNQNANLGRITAIAGTTITTALAANQTGAGQTFYANDALTIDNGNIAVPLGKKPSALINNGYYAATSYSVNISLPGMYNTYEVTPAQPGYDYTVVIERVQRGGTAFQLRASHGNEMSPAVPLGNAATGMLSTNDVYPHGLAWSEPDEPEHVPPKNFARVGDAGKAILALVATRDRLCIFKEDGLFMLTGDTSRNFGIYPLDTTCLCILPGSVRRLKNTVFLLSNLGLVAVDESGSVTIVSRPIQLEVASIVNAIRAAQKASGLYLMPGLSGVTGASDDAQGEYHLALGTSAPSFGGQVLVYSLPRDGFTTFSFGTPAPVALATDGEANPLVLTASSLLTPTTTLGAVTARISPRAFSEPSMVGRFASHVAMAFSKLTGTASVQARFSGSELGATEIAESVEAGPVVGGLIEQPNGSLLRTLIPSALKRSFLTFVELVVTVTSGTFTLEHIAIEERENIPNKRPSHGSGSS